MVFLKEMAMIVSLFLNYFMKHISSHSEVPMTILSSSLPTLHPFHHSKLEIRFISQGKTSTSFHPGWRCLVQRVQVGGPAEASLARSEPQERRDAFIHYSPWLGSHWGLVAPAGILCPCAQRSWKPTYQLVEIPIDPRCLVGSLRKGRSSTLAPWCIERSSSLNEFWQLAATYCLVCIFLEQATWSRNSLSATENDFKQDLNLIVSIDRYIIYNL